ncbi:MAG: SDR family NAD(P)-dependent oxidoreductase, partial [Janthinobacterium lividum]
MSTSPSSPVRSAIVTGAAGGIGRAIALRLAADGLAVSLLDLPGARAGLDAAVSELATPGQALVGDVTDADSVDAAVAAHVARFGGLDVMVANAGIAITAPLVDTTAEQWRTTLDVNLTGVFHCYRAAARQLVA